MKQIIERILAAVMAMVMLFANAQVCSACSAVYVGRGWDGYPGQM